MVAATVLVMGIAATRGTPDWRRLGAATVAMWFIQFFVGITNDLSDRDLDAATKPWKPLVARLVPTWAALGLALTLAIGAGVLVTPLGPGATVLLGAIAVVGLLYNLRLKRTAWSWVPYVMFFPLIPTYAATALGEPAPEAMLLWPAGALLGVSVHLANAVPDLEGDKRHGAAGLTGRLGRSRALMGSWGLLAMTQVAGLAGGIWLGFALVPLVVGAALSVGLLAGAVLVAGERRDPARLQGNFALVCLATMVLAVGWVAGAAWR